MLSGNVPSFDAQIELTRNHILSQPETQYLIQGDSDLRAIEVKHGLASTTTRYQQMIDGLPVHGAIVTINQGAFGDFQQVHHNLAYDTTKLTFPEPLDTVAVNMETF
jgi:Zn-dependent metalloprotease